MGVSVMCGRMVTIINVIKWLVVYERRVRSGRWVKKKKNKEEKEKKKKTTKRKKTTTRAVEGLP